MSHPLLRPAGFALGLLALLAFTCAQGSGQGNLDLKAYRLEGRSPGSDDVTRMNDLMTGKVRVKGPDLAKNMAVFQTFAKHRVYRVTYESYYAFPETGELKPRTGEQNLDVLLNELNSLLLVPTPDRDLSRLTPEQAEYIYEFGAAIDQAVAAVFAKNPPLIVRVNAARILSVAARSGAPAHARTIIALLNNTYFKDKAGKPLETGPEVLLYAIKAAENLLAAYDPTVLVGPFIARHSIPDGELVTLVKLLEDMVLKGPAVADKVLVASTDSSGKAVALPAETTPEGEADPKAPKDGAKVAPKVEAVKVLTPDQVAVVRYYRRAAIRALGKVRFDVVGGRGAPEARPAFTLAKVAVSDPSLSIPPTTSDIAEAVIGLAGIAPTASLNVDMWANAMAIGTQAFVQPRVATPDDRTIPWKVTASRMELAFANMKKGAATNPRTRPLIKPLGELTDLLITDLLLPLEKEAQSGVSTLTVERLTQWLQNNPPKDATKSLYNDTPAFTLNYRTN